MLVLTRVPKETITLIVNEGTENEIRALLTVVRVERNKVKIGIDAPQSIKIIRTEIIDKAIKPDTKHLESSNKILDEFLVSGEK